jgi:predicted Rossmann fold flavoprotein
VIVTTGGLSYPGSGTTGDGLRWARDLGHTIVPTRPALVPITVAETWVPGLKGITLPDAGVQIIEPAPQRRVLAEARGSLLFTHFGLSGPVVLDVSRAVSGHPEPQSLLVECDVWPAVRESEVDARLRSLGALAARPILGEFTESLPRRFAETLFRLVEIPLDRKGSEFSKAERQRLARGLKHLALHLTGTLGYAKAEVTAGGVSLDEIDSRTMQSKLVPGLYFAGEVLDLDGPIGGYNFQAAFATGALAGQSASASIERDS